MRFLRSSEPEDHQLLQSLALTAFAARLVAASEGPDPVSTAELKGATWLLDTNILLTIALEGVAHGDPLDALGQAMSMIESELVYIYPTLAEYRRVVDAWRESTLNALEHYDVTVVRKSSEPFMKIAIARQCYSREDFCTFFDELRDPPRSIEDRIAVSLVDDPDVADAVARGEADEAKALAIQSHWADQRPRPKPLVAARHDAALSEVARHWRSSDKKCFVLTTDRTMADLAASWQGPAGTPSWIRLDALLQVLAADRGGVGEHQVNFSSLLAKLIAQEVQPVANEFGLPDLQWLAEIVEQVGAFPSDVVDELATIVHRKRIAGARRDDPELRLALERTVQEARGTLIKGHGAAVKQAGVVADRAKDVETRTVRLRQALVERTEKGLARTAKRRLFRRSGVALVLATVGGLGGYALLLWILPDTFTRVELFSVAASIAVPLGSFWWAMAKSIWPRYKKERNAARGEAERRVTSVESEGLGP